jgi:hypothetical protein
VARWLPRRRIVAVADSSYAVVELLDAVRRRVVVVTRLRLDARLFAPPPPRTPRTIGRPRVVGARLPTLAQRLGRSAWGAAPGAQRLGRSACGWRGRALASSGRRGLVRGRGPPGRGVLGQAPPCGTIPPVAPSRLWHHPGLPVVPLRWVLVRGPSGEFRPQAFLCTDLEADPAEVLSRFVRPWFVRPWFVRRWFVRRWATEVTFAEARRHLGVETQRQWSDRAIARTTPALLGLYSLVALWADELHRGSAILPRAAAWYAKRAATFSDALAAVRRATWAHEALRASAPGSEAEKVPRAALDRLTDLACYAA